MKKQIQTFPNPEAPADPGQSPKTRIAGHTAFSLAVTFLFALYNGFLGLYHRSVWNGSICVYYLFLLSIRGGILFTEKRVKGAENHRKESLRKRTFYITSVCFILMNLLLAVPILQMVYNQRTVRMGMIPAITMAAYTTCKIVMASVKVKKRKQSNNILTRELRILNFTDALVSVLTLQNTLIVVNGEGNSHDMFVLSCLSSALIFFVILTLPVGCMIKERK